MSDDNLRDDDDLLLRLEWGDAPALTELFTRHRERLGRMIRLRLDRRLQGRIDSSCVLAASNRYMRALDRLKDRLQGMPGFLDV